MRGQRDVVEDGQLPERAGDLEGPRAAGGAARVGREARDLVSPEADGAGRRRQRPGDAVEEGRLPRAVRSDEAQDLALPHLKRDGAEGRETPESPGQLRDREHAPDGSGAGTSPGLTPAPVAGVRATAAPAAAHVEDARPAGR